MSRNEDIAAFQGWMHGHGFRPAMPACFDPPHLAERWYKPLPGERSVQVVVDRHAIATGKEPVDMVNVMVHCEIGGVSYKLEAYSLGLTAFDDVSASISTLTRMWRVVG
jgi:hypothetical protein